MTQTAHQQMLEMTEATEATLARTFGWETPEARLYRECPTAFWLAPDGEGVLAASPVPALPRAAARGAVEEPSPSTSVAGLAGAAGYAILAAGPIFAATALLLAPNVTDDDWWDPIGRAALSLVALPLTTAFGLLLALLPVLAGVMSLGTAGKSIATLRKPAVWALTGGVMGAALATLFDADGPIGLALIATSVACAAIARHFVTWHAPQAA